MYHTAYFLAIFLYENASGIFILILQRTAVMGVGMKTDMMPEGHKHTK